jgi:hypothetical protein
MLLLLKQLFSFTTQTLALITVLDRGEMLPRSEDEAASQDQSTTEQERETSDGTRITFMTNLCVVLL